MSVRAINHKLSEPEPIDAEFEEILQQLSEFCREYDKTIDIRGVLIDIEI